MKTLFIFVGFAVGFFVFARAIAEESRDQNAIQTRTIPLSEIITTGPQENLQNIDKVVGEAEAYDGFMMRFRNVGDGSSNVFLVHANNLRDALNASSNVLFGSRSADFPAPVDTPDPPHGSHWLVAYLGTGPSEPTWWAVESVRVQKSKVVLAYRKPKPGSAADDVRRYYYWIPLGQLNPNTYEIQLVDLDKAAVTLMRRVEVVPATEIGRRR
jgi:hypothetical protein